jgi:hypothetical protein
VNTEQVATVLGKIQLGDNRAADRTTLLEWIDGIGDLDMSDAIAAVRMHRRESAAYLQVFHVRDNVRVLLARRARELRVNSPREIESNVITLDRAEFERLTQAAIDAKKAG